MSSIIIILLIWSVAILTLLAFFMGFKLGRLKDEEVPEIKLPNPIEKIKHREEEKEYKKAQEVIETIQQNIENYDGTSRGQKDIPR